MLQRPEVEMRHLAMHMDDDIGFLVRAVRHIGGGNVRDRREAGVKLLAQPPFLGLQLRKTRLQCRNFFHQRRSEEHTSELQSLMRISYAVFCLKKKKRQKI